MNEFETPQLVVYESKELSLSNQALIEIICAVIDKGVPFKFRTKGNSMEPFIKDGDVVTIYPILTKKPKIGEIVAFVHPYTGKLIVHRIIAKQNGKYLIQGDGLVDHSDNHVPPDCFLGRVKRIERNGQRIRLGLGVERISIAWLVRLRLLVPLRNLLANISGSFNR